MKRLLVLVVLLSVLFCSCQMTGQKEVGFENSASYGVWFSYQEINEMLLSENGFEREVDLAVEKCRNLNIDEVYIHIRAFCDSLFKSDYFPLQRSAEAYNNDAFEYMLKAFHNQNIKVHAWINPYRVLTKSNDINELDKNSPAYKWLNDETTDNDRNVCFSNGIYLNPAENEVKRFVIDGVREVLEKYEVDGIHFDDYFYPTTDPSFDEASYKAYQQESKKPLSLEDWRRANVNSLISGVYSAVKYYNKDIEFSISPAASLEDNYKKHFADISLWIENGYIDTVIPQLYFGFEYPRDEFKFQNLLSGWKKIANGNSEVEIKIGLASYKIGTDAEPDNAEWQGRDDIILRQTKLCFEDEKVLGCVFFSYSSLFSEEPLNAKAREDLSEFINKSEEING